MNKIPLRIIQIIALLTVSSCSNVNTKQDLAQELYSDLKDAPNQEESVPDFVNQALLMNYADASKKVEDKSRFDVTVKNMPAKSFFLSLVSNSKVNVVAHPDVEGSISLQLKNVTIEDVLNVTREVYGYEYRLANNIYTIYPRKLRTEIFTIDYIDVKRVGMSDTSVSVGQVKSGSGKSGGSEGSTSSTGGANIWGIFNDEAISSSSQGIGPGSRVQTVTNTDFWQTIQKTIAAIIGAGTDGANVIVNPQAGLAVVTAMPTEISKVREFLESSELSVKRQVVLETQILEVRLSKGFEAGVNWNAISGSLAQGHNIADGFAVSSDSGAVVQPFRPITRTEWSQSADGTFSSVQIPSREEVGNTIAGILQVKDITKLLSLLETQGKVQVLSSPRVSTVNNQKAVIRVGQDGFFVTGITNNTTSSAATTTNSPEVELASFFSGISLDVTPQISDSGDVILHIHPIISDVSDQQKEIIVGDSKISLPLALREIRESDSIVRAKSGQVVVLGGLMQESVKRVDGKRPGLGDVPGLNLLFKTKNQATSKTELVILLRPIVIDEKTWDQQIQQFEDFSQAIGSYP